MGFYKHDKREGFGIYYWTDDRIFIGFWKEGKQNGVGKSIIKDDIIKYGIWKDGKREKWFENKKEFLKGLDSKSKRYISFFTNDIDKIKQYLDLDDDNKEEEVLQEKNRVKNYCNKFLYL